MYKVRCLETISAVPWLFNQIFTKQDKIDHLPGPPHKQVALLIQRRFVSDPYSHFFFKLEELEAAD